LFSAMALSATAGGVHAADRVSEPGEACPTQAIDSGTHTMEHGGVTRTFRLHVPAGSDQSVARPLIMIFHGWGGNEEEFIGDSAVTSLADERAYILVAPRGLGSGPPDERPNSWSFSGSTTGLDGDAFNPAVAGDSESICDAAMTPDYSYPSCAATRSNTCAWTQCQADDVHFVLELLRELKSKLCIDSRNVFATGGSNGGMFAWELAQNPASAAHFRAIAPLIGLPHRGFLAQQGRPGDLPALLITGTRDDVVPPGAWEDATFTTTSNDDDRFYYTGATAITRVWAAAHGCDVSVPAAAFDAGSGRVDCRSYCSEDRGWPRVLDCRADMGHTFEFSWIWRLVLDFFDAHSGER
jgi:polyhydroxybutyrate depolymerase